MTDIFVIGSVAACQYYNDFPRAGFIKDIDIIGTYDNVLKFVRHLEVEDGWSFNWRYPIADGKKWIFKSEDRIIEAEIAWSGSTAARFMEIASGKHFSQHHLFDMRNEGLDVKAAAPSWLYALKMSHRYLRNSPHFEKTREDILFFQKKGIIESVNDINDMGTYIEWYDARCEETYSYEHPKLNVSKKDFFKDDVPYKYDHDDIHQAVKLGLEPAYTKILDGEVKCSQKKFVELTHVERVRCVYEEAAVLALERAIIPFPEKYRTQEDCDRAFKIALQKVCTSITSGWFREFAWDHYDEVLQMNEALASEFVIKFDRALRNGEIKDFKK